MKTWLLSQLDNGAMDLHKLEQFLWDTCRETFRRLMEELLDLFDRHLAAARDTGRYELKERNPRQLETMLGPISFKRRYYWDHEESRWVYLLDEHLGLESHDRSSPWLCELAVTWATKGPSYRDARDRLADLCGAQVLSHEAIRQMVLEVAASAERDDQNAVITYNAHAPKRHVKALFIEADGFIAALQRRNRPKRKHNRRCEPKLAVVHEGWQVRQGKGHRKDYQLVNPLHMPVLTDAESFWEWMRGYLSVRYADIDKIPVIINGDGAPWIKQGAKVFARGLYQYDRFHLIRDLRQELRHDPMRLKAALKAVKAENVGSLLIVVTEAWQAASDPEVKQRLDRLRETLVEHADSIRDYRLRLREQGFRVNPGWRTMGAAESNVNKFKNRTGKRGRAWVESGLQSILTCMSKLFAGTLSQYATRHLNHAQEWELSELKVGAGFITKQILRSEPPIRSGSLVAAKRGTKGFGALFRDVVRAQAT